jgi:hypothetical protein
MGLLMAGLRGSKEGRLTSWKYERCLGAAVKASLATADCC